MSRVRVVQGLLVGVAFMSVVTWGIPAGLGWFVAAMFADPTSWKAAGE